MAILALALVVISSTLAALTAVTGRPAAAAAAPSLSIAPKVYVGGQKLTWTGNVGHGGIRRLVLQFNMGSAAGNHWNTVEGFSSKTNRDGSFKFTYPAPSMFNIRYRVKAGRYVSPPKTFVAKTQDLTLRKTNQWQKEHQYTNEPALVDVGESFGITVDTTPDDIYKSPDSEGLPVFKGRVLTLQKRADDGTWAPITTTTVGRNGMASFDNLVELPGVSVYRVRQENHFVNGNQIGWHASFPLHVLVGADAQAWYDKLYGLANEKLDDDTLRPTIGKQPETASLTHRWTPSLFDFTWEHGQSLDSPPVRGTRLVGSWVDYSDGSGRVSKYNGGLSLDSKRFTGAGRGDFGTTRATLIGNVMEQGRWEASLRVRNNFETEAADYKILAQLVPAASALTPNDVCQPTITIASITPRSKQVKFGVRTPTNIWSGSTTAPDIPMGNPYNVAVELSNGHITWFLNSAPIASVKSTDAIPGVPMTLRFSLVGDGEKEMNQTGVISDWQRGFPITSGEKTYSRNVLAKKSAPIIGCGG